MWTVIAQYHSEYRLLLAASDSRLIHNSAHDFAVDDDKPPVVGREIRKWFHGITIWPRIVHSIALRLDVDENLRFFIGSHEDVENLFPSP